MHFAAGSRRICRVLGVADIVVQAILRHSDVSGTRALSAAFMTDGILDYKWTMGSVSDLNHGAGRGNRTPMTRRSADFESAASASSAIPAREWYQ